jgi:hypothetical protein
MQEAQSFQTKLRQLHRERGVAAECRLRLDAVLDGADAQLLQAGRLRSGGPRSGAGPVAELGEQTVQRRLVGDRPGDGGLTAGFTGHPQPSNCTRVLWRTDPDPL